MIDPKGDVTNALLQFPELSVTLSKLQAAPCLSPLRTLIAVSGGPD
jgi:hypothetical protein